MLIEIINIDRVDEHDTNEPFCERATLGILASS